MKRKSVTYLNQLKHDLETTLEEIRDLTFDIEEAGDHMADINVHDLVLDVKGTRYLYEDLNGKHLKLSKMLKLLRLQREEYCKFFETNNLQK